MLSGGVAIREKLLEWNIACRLPPTVHRTVVGCLQKHIKLFAKFYFGKIVIVVEVAVTVVIVVVVAVEVVAVGGTKVVLPKVT